MAAAPLALQAPSPQAPALQAPPAPTALKAPHAFSHLESLLRVRKLDRTLTTSLPGRSGAGAVASFGLPDLDAQLFGGLPRGQISELIGPVSSGRTSLAWTWLAAATARGESVALVDTFDRFDPASATTCGMELSRLLWVRGQAITKTTGAIDPAWLPGARAVEGPGTLLERTIDRSLKALNLVLQSGVCTAVVFDCADVPLAGLRRVPLTTWLRLQRVVEGTDTACLLLGPTPIARSAGGVTMTTGIDPTGSRQQGTGHQARWAGDHDRNRRLAGLSVHLRLSSPRRTILATGMGTGLGTGFKPVPAPPAVPVLLQTVAREVVITE
jgi:recA bacterial DNA recombination protein